MLSTEIIFKTTATTKTYTRVLQFGHMGQAGYNTFVFSFGAESQEPWEEQVWY